MRALSLLLAGLLASAAAPAAATVFTVDQKIGATGSVTGTITTDGTTGVLSSANFTAWSLLVSGGGQNVALDQSNSGVYIQGTGPTATATDILFNYSVGNNFLDFQAGGFGTGNTYWCNASATNACLQGASAVPVSYSSGVSFQNEARTGVQAIASVVSGVPESSTWAMFIGGLGMVGGIARRRRQVKLSAA